MSIATAMPTPTQTTSPSASPEGEILVADASEDPPYLLTTESFFAAVEAGVFPNDARVYLRDGIIYRKMAKTRLHSAFGCWINHALFERLPRGWSIFPEAEFQLDGSNAFLPDFALVRGQDRRVFFAPGHYPEAKDIGLLIEIAVTSLAKDLGANAERYSRSLIPNYWVFDTQGRRILVHTRPRIVEGLGEYQEVEIINPGGSLPLTLDGQEVARFVYEDLMP